MAGFDYLENKPKVTNYNPCTCRDLRPGSIKEWCTCGLTKKGPWCDGKSHSGTAFKPLRWRVPDGAQTQTMYSICDCKYTTRPPYCDGIHYDLPLKYLKQMKECVHAPHDPTTTKLCELCGWASPRESWADLPATTSDSSDESSSSLASNSSSSQSDDNEPSSPSTTTVADKSDLLAKGERRRRRRERHAALAEASSSTVSDSTSSTAMASSMVSSQFSRTTGPRVISPKIPIVRKNSHSDEDDSWGVSGVVAGTMTTGTMERPAKRKSCEGSPTCSGKCHTKGDVDMEDLQPTVPPSRRTSSTSASPAITTTTATPAEETSLPLAETPASETLNNKEALTSGIDELSI